MLQVPIRGTLSGQGGSGVRTNNCAQARAAHQHLSLISRGGEQQTRPAPRVRRGRYDVGRRLMPKNWNKIYAEEFCRQYSFSPNLVKGALRRTPVRGQKAKGKSYTIARSKAYEPSYIFAQIDQLWRLLYTFISSLTRITHPTRTRTGFASPPRPPSPGRPRRTWQYQVVQLLLNYC